MARAPPRTHPVVRGFDRAADAYERGRPGYPAAGVRHLGRVLRLGPGRTVVEVGSGTGKFTRALAPLGAARVAIEPTPGMRRVFERVVPDVMVLDGTAEKIPLPDGFADAIVCAQAFHWFRARRAVREFARVLRPGGGVALVWNTRDTSPPWARRVQKVLDRYHRKTRFPGRGNRWRRAFGGPGSPFGRLHKRVFSNAHRASPEAFIDRFLSVSVIAVQPPSEQRRIATEFRTIMDTDPATRGRRSITLPNQTDFFWAFVRPPARRRRRPTGSARTARAKGSRARRRAG